MTQQWTAPLTWVVGQLVTATQLNTYVRDISEFIGGLKIGSDTISAVPAGRELIPTGAIIAYGGSSAPDGWLMCDGSAVSRSTYAGLFARVSTTFGAGNGTTTFNIPNLQDRFPIGDSGSLTLGATGGASSVTLTTTELPAHTHGAGTLKADIAGATGGVNTSAAAGNNTGVTQTGAMSGSTASAGSGAAFSILPPYQVVNYIIKT